MPESTFDGTSVEDLRAWLEASGVSCDKYGAGAAKSVGELLEETQKGESRLTRPDRKALRQLRVLNLFVCTSDKQKVLVEDFQKRPNGAIRRRGLPLSEKLLADEDWKQAVERAVYEELGSALLEGSQTRITVDYASYETDIRERVSDSYPGLLSVYEMSLVDVFVSGLPDCDVFMTEETRREGVLENHWRWVDYTWKAEYRSHNDRL